jgi:hypothetical protein
MEINITATVDYDYEKDEFFLAEFNVVKTDEEAGSAAPKKSPRKPRFQRECKHSGKRPILGHRVCK